MAFTYHSRGVAAVFIPFLKHDSYFVFLAVSCQFSLHFVQTSLLSSTLLFQLYFSSSFIISPVLSFYLSGLDYSLCFLVYFLSSIIYFQLLTSFISFYVISTYSHNLLFPFPAFTSI
jgi:hypothetical protein